MVIRSLFLFAAALGAQNASARDILIANDDGLTANVKALYDALKAEGHDVIVAVPCTGQSGMGGALRIMQPIGALARDCLNGAAKAGAPGAGPMSREGFEKDFYYVDGTPVMAMLYGIDVIAAARWGKAPDLVLSGPNVGQNAGAIVVSSGTVSNVQYALMRKIPAIALSAGNSSGSGADLINPISSAAARRSVELVSYLDRKSRGGRLLPDGTALNVNFPENPANASWRLARIGTYDRYNIRFVPDLAAASGKKVDGSEPQPGLFLNVTDAEPGTGEKADEAAVSRDAISISVMQLAYDAAPDGRRRAARNLSELLGK